MRERSELLLVAHLVMAASACASRPVPQLPARSRAIATIHREAPQRSAATASEAQRQRLTLPSADAPLAPVRAVLVPFSSEQDRPSEIVALQGGGGRVWLLGDSSLYESDGKTIRLHTRAACVQGEASDWDPHFDTITFSDQTLGLLGRSPGGCGSSHMLAERRSDGSWRCTRDTREVSDIRRFWSSGELTTVTTSNWGTDAADFGEPLGNPLSSIPMPLAVSQRKVHAWALVGDEKGRPRHLVEWTGMRWRERADVLPAGIYGDDIVAMTVDDAGVYYLATTECLLVFDGARFVAHPVPRAFSPERLMAAKAYGLWALGGERAWHYQLNAWSYVELPLARVRSQWLAPNGTLWVAGARVFGGEEPKSEQGETRRAVVVTLALPQASKAVSP